MKDKNQKVDQPRARKRKGGVPLGIHHSKMSVPDDLIPKGKVGRWINDTKNRLSIALGDDWEFLNSTDDSHVGGGLSDKNSDIGTRISQIVGSDGKTNEPMRAYLMVKWEDWYIEDQDKKDEKIRALDEGIGRGGMGLDVKPNVDKSHFYGKMDYKA